MLDLGEAVATVPVRNLSTAVDFYANKLGLKKLSGDGKNVQTFESGRSKLLVYQSQFTGTNKATAVTWLVSDVDAVARALKEKGIAFEHYDLPGATREGDVHVMGQMRTAWFKDLDGNILALALE
jgi:catechol 2,3-dioxygenase-like lactoylglutathione lyase family enzyme